MFFLVGEFLKLFPDILYCELPTIYIYMWFICSGSWLYTIILLNTRFLYDYISRQYNIHFYSQFNISYTFFFVIFISNRKRGWQKKNFIQIKFVSDLLRFTSLRHRIYLKRNIYIKYGKKDRKQSERKTVCVCGYQDINYYGLLYKYFFSFSFYEIICNR